MPGFRVAGAQTALQIAETYFVLGVEHILAGIDHLLFVLALMLLIRDGWALVKTITAFTIAHSLTLVGSALGWVSLPQAPVEAVIALSIAFVASELLKAKPGERRLSEAYPWFIAFAFGLLHGFGFAGALKEIGLPQTEVPLALLTFNLGVEAGQLLFVGAVFAVCWIGAIVVRPVAAPLRTVAAYGIGTLATVWFIERLGASPCRNRRDVCRVARSDAHNHLGGQYRASRQSDCSPEVSQVGKADVAAGRGGGQFPP